MDRQRAGWLANHNPAPSLGYLAPANFLFLFYLMAISVSENFNVFRKKLARNTLGYWGTPGMKPQETVPLKEADGTPPLDHGHPVSNFIAAAKKQRQG